MTALRITVVFKHDESEFGGTTGDGWYATVYDVDGKAVFTTELETVRANAVKDAVAWCKTNRPAMKPVMA